MILHSIISPRDIFCNSDTDRQYACPEYRQIKGGLLEIENGQIKRLISTDPRLYLDGRYRPYTKYGEC